MPDPICNPNFDKALPLLGRDENMKLLFDATMNGLLQQQADERRDARRRSSNDAAFDKALDSAIALGFQGLVAAAQEGEGEVETAGGTVEEADAGDAISGQAIAASLGNLASALVPIITAASSLAVSPTQLAQAVLAAVTAASGVAAGKTATS